MSVGVAKLWGKNLTVTKYLNFDSVIHLPQAPLFISFFMGLRGMTNVPVESMRTGGIFWFTDLTVVDPYYLLPVITSATMWLTIELGADSTKLSQANMQTMKYVLRAMPVCILPFTINFPGVSEAVPLNDTLIWMLGEGCTLPFCFSKGCSSPSNML